MQQISQYNKKRKKLHTKNSNKNWITKFGKLNANCGTVYVLNSIMVYGGKLTKINKKLNLLPRCAMTNEEPIKQV